MRSTLFLPSFIKQIRCYERLKKPAIILLSFLWVNAGQAQKIDTIRIISDSFRAEREIYVHKPECDAYRSDEVEFPVIYLLDAQHEWFAQPIISSIKYLQYTHEIPQAIIVEIPLMDRVEECAIVDVNKESSKLIDFISEEVTESIKQYNPNGFNVIMGHSFSASFALYAGLKKPKLFSKIFAHTPLDKFHSIVSRMDSTKFPPDRIYLSIGGEHFSKDKYHRMNYDTLKTLYPSFFASINLYESSYSAHNAVPIVATPIFLTQAFYDYSTRFTDLAKVDDHYKLIDTPGTVESELFKFKERFKYDQFLFPPEIADINGLYSRYSYSGYLDHSIAILELGTELYPNFFEFYWSLGELYAEKGYKKLALFNLNQAKTILRTYEPDTKETREYLHDIDQEISQILK